MKNFWIKNIVLITVSVISGITLFLVLKSDIFLNTNALITILGIIAIATSILTLSSVLTKNIDKKDAITYNIAILGLPKSGKTTFITSLFGAVMHGKIKLNGYNAIVKGNSTIDRINENLSLLDKGIPIGSTTDQTLFAYRVNIEEKSSHILRPRKEYQIEIGDFQGEMTQDLIDLKTNIWKHDSEFFNWVKEANAFVFMVDLGFYLMDKKTYIAEISKSLRSAWQKIIELNDNQIDKESRLPIILIFNKADVLTAYDVSPSGIKYLAFSEDKLPEMKYSTLTDKIKLEVEKDFDDLINFFTINCKNFSYNFYSSFFTDKYEYQKGLSEICNHIFPVYVVPKEKKDLLTESLLG